MANRRMFSLDVCDTDAFLEMPSSTQALYFHLGLRADDDGFLSAPKKITSMVNCGIDDLLLLCKKGFVVPFSDGVCVIRHWRMNNYLRGDRYKPSIQTDKRNYLFVSENGEYLVDEKAIECGVVSPELPTAIMSGIPNSNQRLPQYSIGKDRESKEKIKLNAEKAEKGVLRGGVGKRLS